jgi:hypothetical protein
MRSRTTQFIIRMVLAIGLALIGISVTDGVVAYSAVERGLGHCARDHHKTVPILGSED